VLGAAAASRNQGEKNILIRISSTWRPLPLNGSLLRPALTPQLVKECAADGVSSDGQCKWRLIEHENDQSVQTFSYLMHALQNTLLELPRTWRPTCPWQILLLANAAPAYQ